MLVTNNVIIVKSHLIIFIKNKKSELTQIEKLIKA